MQNLPLQEQEVILADIGENISRQVFLDSYDALSPQNQVKINAAIEVEDAATIAQILSELPNQEEIIERASEKVLDDLTGLG